MLNKKNLKTAFERVKEDILNISNEIFQLKNELRELKTLIKGVSESVILFKLSQKESPTDTPTHQVIIPTHPANPTDTPTHPQEIGGLKSQNLGISMRNEGVPTDRQTDKPTDIFQQKTHEKGKNNPKLLSQQIQDASEILSSLDEIKKEIRQKFKQITTQEMLIFSTIYQMEELDPGELDYRKIALKLSLSESSIRDYVQRIINKGIPILKTKLNNKKILLSISPELKKITSLQTIIKLREI